MVHDAGQAGEGLGRVGPGVPSRIRVFGLWRRFGPRAFPDRFPAAHARTPTDSSARVGSKILEKLQRVLESSGSCGYTYMYAYTHTYIEML